MKFKFIDQIGAELEGGWEAKRLSHPKYSRLLHGDGSVNVNDEIIRSSPKQFSSGEIQTPPFGNLLDLIKFIKNFYPDLANASCGFHIHISLKNDLLYSRLMDKNFHEYMLKRFEKWGKTIEKKWTVASLEQFWLRHRGLNKFCSKDFRPFAQAQVKHKADGRYTQLNYCYGLHGTIELRLLPMFKEQELAISAVKCYVKLVEQYLSRKPSQRSRRLVKKTLYPRFTSLKNRVGLPTMQQT
jgi:hypothetical protein